MQVRNYKLFIQIILLIGCFTINSFAVIAMEEAETAEKATPIATDIDNNGKQVNNSIIEDNKITEDNKPTSLQPEDEIKPTEITTSEEVASNVDSIDKTDVDSKKSNEDIASIPNNEDTENKQLNENNKQDNKILIENSYISINPGDNAAGYLTIQNKTDENIRLAEVKIQNNGAVKKIETHDNHKMNKVIKMVHKKNGFKIKANSDLKLKEGGKHIMLFGINKDFFADGKNIDLTLKFISKDKSIIEIIQNFDIKQLKCKKCCAD
jgi:copper(I)-binding protein